MTLPMVCLVLAAATPLRWGADSQGGAPYVFENPTHPDETIGFEVEVMAALAQAMNRAPELVTGPYEKLLDLLDRGDFELVLNGIENTPEKKKFVALSQPYYAAPLVLTIRRDDKRAPRSPLELKGRVVGTLPSTQAERVAHALGAQVKVYEGGQDDIYGDLKLERLDAVLLDAPIATYYASLNPNFESLVGGYGTSLYSVALRTQDTEVLARVDLALEELKTKRTLETIYRRWGLWNQETADLFSQSLGPPSEAPRFDEWKSSAAYTPNLRQRLFEKYPALLPQLLKGAALTLVVSLLAFCFASLLGLALAMARSFGPRWLSGLSLVYVEFFRGTPLLIQLTMIYFGLPELGLKLPPLAAGILALGLNYAASEAENQRAGFQSVPESQWEAAHVLGLSWWQTFSQVVLPQALRMALPPMTNDFIALLKDSSLVSLVTLTELTRSYTSLANATHDHLGLGALVALLYLAMGLPVAQLARHLETRFARHLERGH
jgi:polar amino acid transport system substrate-binding protein